MHKYFQTICKIPHVTHFLLIPGFSFQSIPINAKCRFRIFRFCLRKMVNNIEQQHNNRENRTESDPEGDNIKEGTCIFRETL